MSTLYPYLFQMLVIAGLVVGSKGIVEDKYRLLNIARYIIYILTTKSICVLYSYTHVNKPCTRGAVNWWTAIQCAGPYCISYIASVAVLLYFEQKLFIEDFVYVFLAFLFVQYFGMSNKASISYGVGMACSYYEGYLVHVLPSDGARFIGFEENIRALEDSKGVLVPVKKLFIVVTKSLYCPPDLKEFNKTSDDLPYLEVIDSLEDVVRNVAGVRNRQYRNTAYKINRPGAGAAGALPPVCLAAECATPLHTLHKVITNRTLYDELADIDVPSVVEDFTKTLRNIIEKSPQCRGKCDIVIYDDQDPTQNLADILLERIRHFEPKFEEKIVARIKQNVLE